MPFHGIITVYGERTEAVPHIGCASAVTSTGILDSTGEKKKLVPILAGKTTEADKPLVSQKAEPSAMPCFQSKTVLRRT